MATYLGKAPARLAIVTDDSVTSAKIVDNTVTSADILNATITGADLASDISITTSGNLSLSDSSTAYFGDDNDLSVYHNGSTGYIAQTTGSLFIRNYANDQDIYLQSDDGSGGLTTYLTADGSTGEVQLNYYGDTKIKTTSTGVEVTGFLGIGNVAAGYTPLNTITINTSSDIPFYTHSTDVNNFIVMSDTSGSIKFGTTADRFAIFTGGDAGGGTAPSSTSHYANNAVERFSILSDGKVGIGTTSPEAYLHVIGGVALGSDTVENHASGSLTGVTKLVFGGDNNANGVVGGRIYSSGNALHIQGGTSGLNLRGANNTVHLNIDCATGNVGICNNLTVAGNLTVNGTTTTLNTATLDIEDKTLCIAKGAADATAADGAGIIVDGASACLTFTNSTNSWDFNENVIIQRPSNEPTNLIVGNSINNHEIAVCRSGSNPSFVKIQAHTNEPKIMFCTLASGGGLRFSDPSDNVLMKLTTAGRLGIGTTSPSSQLHITGSDTSDQVIFENTDAGTGTAPDLVFYRNSSSPAVNDLLGRIDFRGKNDGGSSIDYAFMYGVIEDETAGTEDGALWFNIEKNGSVIQPLKLKANENVFNDNGEDINFRIESNNNANIFFVDAGNDKIGIGGIPTERLTVIGTNNTSASELKVKDTDGRGILIESPYSGSGVGFIGTDGTNSALGFKVNGTELARFGTNGYLGIGTVSPSTTLDVSGTVTATTFSGSGASLTNIPNGALDNSSITINGSSVSLGGSATISAGTDWQAAKTSSFTAVAGEGYFINTTSGAITMTLPASPSLGDEIRFVDLASTFDTNNLTIARNGNNINGAAADLVVSTEDSAFGLVYSGATYGWKLIEVL